jgi:hypothetical protein
MVVNLYNPMKNFNLFAYVTLCLISGTVFGQNTLEQTEILKNLEERVRILEEKLVLKVAEPPSNSSDKASTDKKKTGKRLHGSILLVRNSGEAFPVVRTNVKLFSDEIGKKMSEKWNSLPQIELAAAQYRGLPQGLQKDQYFMQFSALTTSYFIEEPILEIKTDIKGEFNIDEIKQDAVWVFSEFKTNNVYGFWLKRVSINQEQPAEVTLDHDNMNFLLQ